MSENESLQALLASGNYSRQQLLCRSGLISWSHASRFRLARSLLEDRKGDRLLDYGCGDGTFLLLSGDLFREQIGLDRSEKQVGLNRERFRAYKSMVFGCPEELRRSEIHGSCGVVTCMETLEHCTDEDVARVLDDLDFYLAPGGRLLVSVPIEIGASLALKQVARRLAGWRRLGDYQYYETYRPGEFLRMVCAGVDSRIPRKAFSDSDGSVHHGHKGFNWRALGGKLAAKFVVEKTVCSPVPWLGSLLNSQVFFVCRK